MTTPRRDAAFQTAIGRWLQANPRLDSFRHGIAITDTDMIIHKYKQCWDRFGCASGREQRSVQHLMLVEIKTHLKAPPFSQADTLRLLDAVLMNRSLEQQKTAKRVFKCRLKKCINKRGEKVDLKIWGCHLLQLSGEDPPSSQRILWNKIPITQYHLECLLRFDLNPFTLKDLSDRRHHKSVNGRIQS